jgi:hypothetical protein
MDPKFISLNQEIGRVIKVPADQGRILATVFAMAAAAAAPLPSSPLDNIPAYFAAQVFPQATQQISEANESVIFSATSAVEYTKIFWKMRYNAAFPATLWLGEDPNSSSNPMSMATYNVKYRGHTDIDAISAYIGTCSEMSPEYFDFINKYKMEIINLLNTVMYIFIGSKKSLEAELENNQGGSNGIGL